MLSFVSKGVPLYHVYWNQVSWSIFEVSWSIDIIDSPHGIFCNSKNKPIQFTSTTSWNEKKNNQIENQTVGKKHVDGQFRILFMKIVKKGGNCHLLF